MSPIRPRVNPFLFFLVFLLAVLSKTVLASVLAIDYGDDWIKASLLKPGIPFDVVLNRDSKRKIQSSVGWKNTDRLFGSDAFNVATRFPSDSFSHLKDLQGVPFDSDAVSFYVTISGADVAETSRHTIALRRPDGTEWSVEELVAMQFAYVKELAESVGGGARVQDVVVTVPPFYTQFQRDAVADAIEVAGMRTLALINDGTAVAVNYAMTRQFPTTENHIIYDAGASSIRASVVSFTTVPGDPKARPATKDSTHISILGVGYDRSAGGTELDRRLRDILVADFEEKHKKDIRSDKRGMAKLWKEAGRVKAILSANAEAQSTVESVAFDIDFRTKITRTAFEEACADLNDHFAQPIIDALANAALNIDDISSVVLTGGSSRTPMIQTAVKKTVGEGKIAQNVNADEAAVLGAALYGASLSRQYKTKDIKVSDIIVHDIQVAYPAEAKTESAQPRTIHTTLFPVGSKVGSKKTLTFKRHDDFSITLSYKNPPFPGFPTDLVEAEITGVAEALANLTERGAVEPVVKATVVLSESGFASVQDVIAFGDIKDDTFTGKLKDFFGGGSTSSEEADVKLNTGVRDTETSSTVDSASVSPSSTSTASADKKKQTPTELSSIPLKLNLKPLSIPALTPTEKFEARERLIAIDRAEATKRRREEVRNYLEGYLYRLRDLLAGEGAQSPEFMKCSKEHERAEIAEKLQETFDWLQEEGDNAETAQFLDKQATLETLEKPVVNRYMEIREWPIALNISQMWNWNTRLFLAEAYGNLTTEEGAGLPSKWTREELEALQKTLADHEEWLTEATAKQRAMPVYDNPAVLVAELRARAKTLESHLQRLVKRKAPKPRKTTSGASTSTTNTTVPPGETSSTPQSETASTDSNASAETPSIHDEL